MLVAQSEADFNAYIGWLSDYLYRPSAMSQQPLSDEEAGIGLIGIEIEIADWIWTHPIEDYPPEGSLPANGARHADILHREAMSAVLSRVPDRAVRIKLIHDFYTELDCDAHK